MESFQETIYLLLETENVPLKCVHIPAVVGASKKKVIREQFNKVPGVTSLQEIKIYYAKGFVQFRFLIL